MNPIIKCEHTDFGCENHDAVIDLNLEIYPGDYLCVVGENGSGKSTLIKGMLGLLKPTGGSLSVADELKRGGIGYLPQHLPCLVATHGNNALRSAFVTKGNLASLLEWNCVLRGCPEATVSGNV